VNVTRIEPSFGSMSFMFSQAKYGLARGVDDLAVAVITRDSDNRYMFVTGTYMLCVLLRCLHRY